MNFTQKHRFIFFGILAVFLLLCVRPAHATTSPGLLCRVNNLSTKIFPCTSFMDGARQAYPSDSTWYGTYGSCVFQPSGTCNVTGKLSAANGGWSIDASVFISGTVSCVAPQVLNQTTWQCETPPLTPQQQAAQNAYDAAIAAGHSPAAAQAAKDAVNAHYGAYQGVPDYLAGIGSSAAHSYDYATSQGVPASLASQIAAGAGNFVADTGATSSFTSADAVSIANTMADVTSLDYSMKALIGQAPNSAQMAASLAAGALGVAAGVVAVSGGAPLTAALLLSGAIHSGILAVGLNQSDTKQVAAVKSAAATAIQSGAQPLQVTIATQAASNASASASADSGASAGGKAAINALTNPTSNWSLPSSPTPAQQSQALSISQAAATAAAKASSNGLSQAAIDASAQAAAAAKAAGYSTTQAATAGQAAAATVAAGGTGSAAVAAGVGTAAGAAAGGGATGDFCTQNPNSAGCASIDPATVPAGDGLQTKTIDVSTFAFDSFSFSGSAGCPAPRTVTLSSGPYTMSYQPLCDFLSIFRLAILAVAFFVGAMIFMGQRTTDSGA